MLATSRTTRRLMIGLGVLLVIQLIPVPRDNPDDQRGPRVTRVNPMPGSTYTVVLANGQELPVSRIQSRLLRETILKL